MIPNVRKNSCRFYRYCTKNYANHKMVLLLDGEQQGFVGGISGVVKNLEGGAASEGQRNCFISPDSKKSKMDIEDLLMWFRFDSAWGGPFVMSY